MLQMTLHDRNQGEEVSNDLYESAADAFNALVKRFGGLALDIRTFSSTKTPGPELVIAIDHPVYTLAVLSRVDAWIDAFAK